MQIPSDCAYFSPVVEPSHSLSSTHPCNIPGKKSNAFNEKVKCVSILFLQFCKGDRSLKNSAPWRSRGCGGIGRCQSCGGGIARASGHYRRKRWPWIENH